MEKFTRYYSATVLGLGNNNGIYLKPDTEYIFKSYYKLRCDGKEKYRLFFVNRVETTGNCRIGKIGDRYTIKEAYAAFSEDKLSEEGKTDITFFGKKEKAVDEGEEYSCDEFEFTYDKKGYMVLTFVVKTEGRVFLPSTNESASYGIVYENGKEIWYDNFTLRPAFIGADKRFEKTVGFWGDSITQGSRTGIDKYEAWTHRIGNSLPEQVSFYNIGMGWARAYDACEDGVFIEKAKMCDEIFLCFGVNDIKSGGRKAEDIINDIKLACSKLRENNKDIKIHLLTVPPFNMSRFEEAQRQKVNKYIISVNGHFDIAKYLECDNIGEVRREYMAGEDDAHPNGEGGRAVFEGFELWRDRNKW